MKKIKRMPLQSIILALEALLVIIGIVTGSDAKICMACYWGIIMVYHAAEFIAGTADDAEQDLKGDA